MKIDDKKFRLFRKCLQTKPLTVGELSARCEISERTVHRWLELCGFDLRREHPTRRPVKYYLTQEEQL